MTSEQKIIAIAEFDGYKPCPETKIWYALGPDEILAGFKDGIVAPLPPYLTSRDAICGAVARLDENTFDYFVIHLQKVTGGVPLEPNALRKILLATPVQLADALLLTLGHEI